MTTVQIYFKSNIIISLLEIQPKSKLNLVLNNFDRGMCEFTTKYDLYSTPRNSNLWRCLKMCIIFRLLHEGYEHTCQKTLKNHYLQVTSEKQCSKTPLKVCYLERATLWDLILFDPISYVKNGTFSNFFSISFLNYDDFLYFFPRYMSISMKKSPKIHSPQVSTQQETSKFVNNMARLQMSWKTSLILVIWIFHE